MSESVLQRIAGGDANAMHECIRDYGTLVWGMARRFTRTRADAEDAAQEIFFDVWRNAGRADPAKGSDKMFISVIAKRRSIDRLRKIYSQPATNALEDLEHTGLGGAPDTAERSVDAELAVLALGTLRAEYRQVLELSLLDGLSQAQIAVQLDVPLGTVKSCIRRGLTQVRDVLSRQWSSAGTARRHRQASKQGRFAALPRSTELFATLTPIVENFEG